MECAYCNNKMGGSLVRTKEHIIPDGLIKLFPEEDITFIKDKSFKDNNGLTIKDVCNICNNGVLSDLDSYGNGIIANHFMCSFGIADNYNREFQFEFNYHLLSRWLLKIAYNYERVYKSNTKWFKDNVNYILKGEKYFKDNISLFAGLHVNMIPVPEDVHGKFSLSIIKNPKLLPLGVTYSIYNEERNKEMLISSGQIENIYVIRFASAVFLIILWMDVDEKEKYLIEEKINNLFTFEKLIPEKNLYKVRRVSEAFNCTTGYGAISGKIGLELSEKLIKHSIGGRNFWEARAKFTKLFPADYFDKGRRMIEEIEYPQTQNKNKKK
ncbi:MULTISPECIES: hypothetical protein [Bacillaceae]|uniref:HNH endonuclease 5 domain-containing protein n=1 Tax=Oceanobacillus caeni TaxID=405946 RepID=A0ABR5MKZ3_9BACI|nr:MULTISPECIES: hypothetical protein [Bacillaceae]KPH76565.1 hypothetical protein AFL42_05640 [Oceanobacillus caeni]